LLGPAVVGAVLYPDEAHCDPLRFVRAVGEAAERAGASLLTRTEALQLRSSRELVEIDTQQGSVRARAVVLAVGASRSLLPGARPCTRDGLPMIGPQQGRPNVIAATGHAMLGITLAPVTALLVRQLLVGERDDPRLDAVRPTRF